VVHRPQSAKKPQVLLIINPLRQVLLSMVWPLRWTRFTGHSLLDPDHDKCGCGFSPAGFYEVKAL
jgi:hypothetical protein